MIPLGAKCCIEIEAAIVVVAKVGEVSLKTFLGGDAGKIISSSELVVGSAMMG